LGLRIGELRVDESISIQRLAEEVFGDSDKVSRWLREPLGILGGKSPVEWAQTESGARMIQEILAKIDWGAAA
jgi:uncharacterized protein (DUF2384 family)